MTCLWGQMFTPAPVIKHSGVYNDIPFIQLGEAVHSCPYDQKVSLTYTLYTMTCLCYSCGQRSTPDPMIEGQAQNVV